MQKLPMSALPIDLAKVLSIKPADRKELAVALAAYTGAKHIYLAGSGVLGFYKILKVLKRPNKKNEVILPAFTAGSLIVAIRKAGLKPVLCDISMNDFNMDITAAGRLVGKDTLAVLGVHMFGIVNMAFDGMKSAFPDIYMIEDCAQAMGSRGCGKSVGSMGDVSFFSFNKGKNMPLVKGGFVATNDPSLGKAIECEISGGKYQTSQVSLRIKMAILALLADPFAYGLFYGMLDAWRDKKPPMDIEEASFTDIQAGFGLELLKMLEGLSEKRYMNGMKLLRGLEGAEGLILPRISADTRPAFNRLPIVFKDIRHREAIAKELWRSGIETGSLYPEPLHHMFRLGYARDEFPNASYVASHLWTFPVHPMVTEEDIDRMTGIIRRVLKDGK